MQDLRVLGVITARGGSKGVPRKNIRPLGGKPLIAWTIDAARHSTGLTSFLVSTEDEEIARVSREHGAPVPFLRPAELASDTAKSIPVIQHALEWLTREQGETYDAVMILQPTSPFRTAADIDEAIRILRETGADSVMSMVKLEDYSPKKLKRIAGDGRILPLFEDEGRESAQRDAAEAVYKRNCAIYLTKTRLLVTGDLFGADSRAHVMPAERSVDINTPFDFLVAETLAARLAADQK